MLDSRRESTDRETSDKMVDEVQWCESDSENKKNADNYEIKEKGKVQETEKSEKPEYKRLLTNDLEAKYKDTPLTDDTTCGYGFLKSKFLQK